MTVLTEPHNTTEASVTDRRRPGRLTDVSPELIPLLRASERESIQIDSPDLEFDEPDQVAPARGILSGVALSVPLWVGFAYVVRWLVS